MSRIYIYIYRRHIAQRNYHRIIIARDICIYAPLGSQLFSLLFAECNVVSKQLVSIRIARLHPLIYRARRSTGWLAACFLSTVLILIYVHSILSTMRNYSFSTRFMFIDVFLSKRIVCDSNKDKKYRFNEIDENWYPRTKRIFYWISRFTIIFPMKYFFFFSRKLLPFFYIKCKQWFIYSFQFVRF